MYTQLDKIRNYCKASTTPPPSSGQNFSHPEGCGKMEVEAQIPLTLKIFHYIFKKNFFWICWVFVAVRGFSLVAASRGYSLLRCAGFSLQRSFSSRSTGFSSCGIRALECAGFSSCVAWAQQLRHVGSRVRGLQQLWHVGSVVVAHGLSCSTACGIFLDQGSNPCPLQWQADS